MKEGNQPFNAQKALRVACLVLADLILINLSAFLALYIRFEFDLKLLCETEFLHNMIVYSGINSVCTILIFYILKLYNSLWEFAGVSELVRTAVGCFFSAVFYMVGMFMLHLTVPRSFPAIYMLVLCLLCGALRFVYRFARRTRVGLHSQGGKRTMLIGGGQAGAIVLREFQTSPRSENKVVCIIDDSPDKVGSYLRGVKIVGGRSSIPAMAEKYDVDEIVLAIPSASRQEKLQILSYCHDTSCSLRTLPGICQLANGEVRIEQIREVDIEDLLGRETVKIDLDEVAAYITGKTVLVTGGGGSIGSELCRQAAAQRPKRLIIFDIYENNAYDIQMELQRTHPELDLVVLIGSVRDRERVMQVFDRYRPDLVCHAAAHKHVPLMETSPFEAIKNNVFGTYNVAQAESVAIGKPAIHDRYRDALAGLPLQLPAEPEDVRSNRWLTAALLAPDCGVTPGQIIAALAEHNIEARHIWKPMHLQPVFHDCAFVKTAERSVAEDVFARGVCLPSDTKMTPEQQAQVCAVIRGLF